MGLKWVKLSRTRREFFSILAIYFADSLLIPVTESAISKQLVRECENLIPMTAVKVEKDRHNFIIN